MRNEKVEKGKQLVNQLIDTLRELSDSEVGALFDPETVDNFLDAILNPSDSSGVSVAEFLLENKTRASLLSKVRLLILERYSFWGDDGQKKGYCSPAPFQWFDDGVMFLSGTEPFSGYIGLYRKGEVRYAIPSREISAGEELSSKDFEFLSIKDYDALIEAIPSEQILDIERPIRELQELLESKNNNESVYQSWLQQYPWILGIQYSLVESHTKFDDKNIPDFTGLRVHDRTRDIIEIKPPFSSIFLDDGEFSSKFLQHWNQAERYLNFALEEKDYLRRKGLIFDNPRCFLITGFDLSDNQRRKLRVKERFTPAIQVYTYNELMQYAQHTVGFIKSYRGET